MIVLFFSLLVPTALAASESPDFVITALTPWLHRRDSNPLAKDLIRQAPYVHWTCYGRVSRLDCCKNILQMTSANEQLRWQVVEDETPLHTCTTRLMEVPSALQEPNASLSPTFTYLQIPQGFPLKVRSWTQALGWPTGNNMATHWIHQNRVSPYRLAPELASKMETKAAEQEEEEQDTTPTTTIQSTFHANDDDEFALHYRIDQAPTSYTLVWTLPETVQLQDVSISDCQVQQTGTSRIVVLQLNECPESVRLTWQISLEDDEEYLIPPVVAIFSNNNLLLELDFPLWTDLDEAQPLGAEL